MVDVGDFQIRVFLCDQGTVGCPGIIQGVVRHRGERRLQLGEPFQGSLGSWEFLLVQYQVSIGVMHRHQTLFKTAFGNGPGRLGLGSRRLPIKVFPANAFHGGNGIGAKGREFANGVGAVLGQRSPEPLMAQGRFGSDFG